MSAGTWDGAPVAVVHGGSVELHADDASTRMLTLGATGAGEVGLWEIDPGTAHDVEVDEVFVVLSGRATVSVEGWPDVAVGPGDVVRLRAGAARRGWWKNVCARSTSRGTVSLRSRRRPPDHGPCRPGEPYVSCVRHPDGPHLRNLDGFPPEQRRRVSFLARPPSPLDVRVAVCRHLDQFGAPPATTPSEAKPNRLTRPSDQPAPVDSRTRTVIRAPATIAPSNSSTS